MKQFASLILLVVLILSQTAFITAQEKKQLEGIFLGTLKVPNAEMRLGLTLSKNNEGILKASFNSVDQGSGEISFDSVALNGNHIHTFSKIGLEIEGDYTNNYDSLIAEFRQGPAKFPIVFCRVENLPVLHKKQDPKKPYPYVEEEVIYKNETADVKLAATLTIPEGKGPFPAVVLLSGSGPQDRNEQLFGHKPFLILADYLTRNGIAVLRADDRGVGGSTGNFIQSTTGDFADDGLAGIQYLKGRKEIDGNNIGFIGHSEGGMMAPIAAAKSTDVAFIVLLAGPGSNLADNVIYQRSLLMKKRGAEEKAILAQKKWLLQLNEIARKEISETEVTKEIKNAYHQQDTTTKELLAWSEKRLQGETERVLQVWWRYGIRYKPKETIKSLDCPLLALLGEKDKQVPVQLNKLQLENALASGNSQSEVKVIPGVNHLFQTCETGDESEYAKLEETISPVVLETIDIWIKGLK